MRIKRIGIAFLGAVLAAAFAVPAAAEDALVSFYDNELVKVSYQAFGGLTLVARGQSSSSSMGVSSTFKDILCDFPDSREAYQGYARKNAIGNVLLYGGLACSLGGLYYPMLSLDGNMGIDGYYRNYRTSLYLTLGGLVAEIVGSFMVPLSFQDLLASVNLYNRDKIAQYR